MDETGDGTQGRARKSIPVNIPLPPSATLSISCCVDAPDFDRLPRHLLLTPFEKRRCPLFRGHIGNLTSQRIGALAVHGALLVVGRIPHPSVIGGGKERQIAEAVNCRFPLRARKRLLPFLGWIFGQDMFNRGGIGFRITVSTGQMTFEPGQDVLDNLLALSAGRYGKRSKIVQEFLIRNINGFLAKFSDYLGQR